MIDEEEMLLMNNIKRFISGLIKAADIHEFNKLSQDKLVSFEFVTESGNLVKERIVLETKENSSYSKTKNEFSQKLITLDAEKRKQLLFELLTIEINSKIEA
jgi:hypothetical protein